MDCTGIDSPNLNCLSESGSERVREEVLWAFFFGGGVADCGAQGVSGGGTRFLFIAIFGMLYLI